MGNCLKLLKKNEYESINVSCPVCLMDFETNDTITLECNHKLHTQCALHLSKSYVYENKCINCPICRKKIKTKNLKKILKYIDSVDIPDPLEWTRKDVIPLEKISFNKINISNNKFFYNSDGFNLPFYIKISNLQNLKFYDNILSDTDYPFELAMSLNNFGSRYLYQKFINVVYRYYPFSQNLEFELRHSRRYVFFIVEKSDEIKVTDIYDGEVHDSFVLKENMNVSIIVKPTIYNFNNNIYYFNKLISILYS